MASPNPYDQFDPPSGANPYDQFDAPTAPTVSERATAGVAGLNRGVAGLLGMPVDTIENAINLGLSGLGTAATAIGKPDAAPPLLKGSFGGSQSLADWFQQMRQPTRNPRPDDPASRMLYTGGTIAGGSLFPGAGIKPALTAATGGAIAGEALGPEWTGVGALLPGAVAQTASAAKARMSANAAPRVETFEKSGATPSAGQATDSAFLRGLENLASKFPGGAGIIKSFVEKQQAAIGSKARTGVSGEAAGRAIEQGVKGPGGFLERTKSTWQALDDAVAQKMPQSFGIAPVNTLSALDDLTRPTPGAEKTSRVMSTPKIVEINTAMRGDMAGAPSERIITLLGADGKPLVQIPIGGTPGKEVLPYESLRELRSKVGSKLDDALVSGIPTGELKKLYGALSKDMEAAANQAGAAQEFARQNNYYRARMGRIESVLDRVIGKGKQPEDIFKTFYPTDPDQANKVRAVMRSLEPAERKIVSDAVVNRLGRATPGQQNIIGDVFSSETFLTNWNKLSTGAKAQLFPDLFTRSNVENIAKAADMIRAGKGIYANPSGTAGSFAAYSIFMAPLTAAGYLAAGTPGAAGVLATAGAQALGANITARMMTNPKVVEWLARPVKPSDPASMTAHLARLGVIYNQTKDESLKGDLANFIQSVNPQGK